MTQLKNLLDDHQTGMSQFQDDYFVTTRAGGTLYGQYKQSLRELYKRFRGLRELTCSQERLIIDIEELEEKIDKSISFELKRAKVDHKEKIMLMEESTRVIKDTEREFTRFYQQACFFKEQIGELTDEKRSKLDQEMWIFKVKEMALIDWVTTGYLRNSTYEFLNSLPKKLKQEVALEINNQDKLRDWYENREEIIPENLNNTKIITTKEILKIGYK